MKAKHRGRAWLAACLLAIPSIGAAAPLESGEPLPLTSPSAILAEASTGTVIFEKNADENDKCHHNRQGFAEYCLH